MYEKLKEESYQNFGGINVKLSDHTTEVTEFLDLRNYTLERIGALTCRPGTESHLTLPVSTYIKKPFNTYVFEKQNGASYLVFDSGPTLYSFGATNRPISGSLTVNATTSAVFDFVTAQDKMYFALNGLRSFDGENVIKTNLSEIPSTVPNVSNGVTFNTGVGSQTLTIPVDDYFFGAAWLRGTPSLAERKIAQSLTPVFTTSKFGFTTTIQDLYSVGSTIQSIGLFQAWGFTAPTDEGVSSMVVAMSRLATGITAVAYTQPLSFTLTTVGGVTTYLTEFPFITTSTFTYEIQSPTARPASRIAYFNNMLVTANENTLNFSTLEDIESFPPENRFEISGNPNDDIVNMVPFQDSLVVFKRDSVHEVTGDSPETISIVDVSFEYGLTNERGFCVFENRLFFVDQKGICEYRGANTDIVSTKIESFMDSAQKEKMAGIHVKKLNQVWFSDGSLTFVFDYITNAWLIYDGLPLDNESGLFNVKYSDFRQDVFYWKAGASFHEGIRFSSSLSTDLGSAITLLAKTRYHKRLGASTEEMWRRFYLNADYSSVTLGVTLNFRPNYGDDISLVASLPMGTFQERLDFGLPAKSMSVEWILNASTKVRINGYTIESRYLRSV